MFECKPHGKTEWEPVTEAAVRQIFAKNPADADWAIAKLKDGQQINTVIGDYRYVAPLPWVQLATILPVDKYPRPDVRNEAGDRALTDETLFDMLEYLDDLRDLGAGNPVGNAGSLADTFPEEFYGASDRRKAREAGAVIIFWMATYEARHP